jgi:Transposase DDE domain group 1
VLMAHHGIEEARSRKLEVVHLDIDTTVEELFGTQEGALSGYNPRFHGRPSYHPLLAVVAETGTCVGARLRPGDRNFGDADAKDIRTYVDRVRAAVGADARLVVRIDGAADCTEILEQIDDAGAHFLVKARLTPDLLGALMATKQWTTVDYDADGRAVRQVAEIHFVREEWKRRGLPVRVIAVRSTEHDIGKQTMLWPELDYSVQVYLTSDIGMSIEDLALEYNGRAEIEPTIGELKGALGLGKVPSQSFNANHAAFLIKLLSHNLVKRYVRAAAPETATWRLPWLRRALFTVPARFVRSGRRWSIRVPPNSMLHSVMCRLE